ncbi:MAG: type II toxin-antitoxin system VapB family antitoxin [Ginsengibacter sp.]
MKTNIEIDDDLLQEATKFTKIKSKKKLVNYALQEYIELCKRGHVISSAKSKETRNKTEADKTKFIKSELSEEKKYKRRLQLLLLSGRVEFFN